MNIKENLKKMEELQNIILEILDGDDFEKKKDSLNNMLTSIQFQKDHYKLKTILSLIIRIANNHHRGKNFHENIFQILNIFIPSIKQTWSNDEIFDIFKSNNRILLFLIEEGIFQINESIAFKMTDKQSDFKFRDYFFPELKPFIEEVTNLIEPEIPSDFDEKRKIGENDSYICKLVREDLIDDFITYVNQTNYNLEVLIEVSPYETNEFLKNQSKPALIEYAAFFGSLQIMKYMYLNHVRFTPSLLLYAIHGSNAEMIHFLEENDVKPIAHMFDLCLGESIKCHHNDIATYLNNNYKVEVEKWIKDDFNENIVSYSFHYRNYCFFPDEINANDNLCFCYACMYDYLDIVEYFLNEGKVNINEEIVLIIY